jgi:predicted alpha/beta superfamily hydrolase
MRIVLLATLIALAGCGGPPKSPPGQTVVSTATAMIGVPVTVPRATQFDITSRINGQTYRVMVEVPFQSEPGKAYPVLYVLDGNQYFGTATDALTRQSILRTTGKGIVVGIGYATEDPEDVFRLRAFDLTLSASQDPKEAGKFGGADAFIRVLEEEIRPFVQARYNIDPARQGIWGQSFAGLTVLRILFRKPEAFSAYALSSPSIWWNDREVLADEASFSRRAIAGELRLKVLVTSAGDEQYSGTAPKLLAGATSRMVDNATELAKRLAALRPQNLVVTRTIFDGEVHNTVSPASLSRTMRFAFPIDK